MYGLDKNSAVIRITERWLTRTLIWMLSISNLLPNEILYMLRSNNVTVLYAWIELCNLSCSWSYVYYRIPNNYIRYVCSSYQLLLYLLAYTDRLIVAHRYNCRKRIFVPWRVYLFFNKHGSKTDRDTIYKTVDKNTEDKKTKNTHVTRWILKTCDVVDILAPISKCTGQFRSGPINNFSTIIWLAVCINQP